MRSNQFAAWCAEDRAPLVIADIHNVDKLREERGFYVARKVAAPVNPKRRPAEAK